MVQSQKGGWFDGIISLPKLHKVRKVMCQQNENLHRHFKALPNDRVTVVEYLYKAPTG